MNQDFFAIVLIGLVSVGIAVASAQDARGGMGKGNKMPVFSDCDLNGDGVIGADEFYQARSQRMAKRAAEGRKMKHAADAPTFDDIDTDGDGEVGLEEFNAHRALQIEKRKR